MMVSFPDFQNIVSGSALVSEAMSENKNTFDPLPLVISLTTSIIELMRSELEVIVRTRNPGMLHSST